MSAQDFAGRIDELRRLQAWVDTGEDIAEAAVAMLSDAALSRSEAYLIMGAVGQMLKDAAQYGDSSIQQLAEAAGLHASSVYNAIKVLDAFGLSQAAELIFDTSLKWCHLVRLARFPEETRALMTARAVEEGWTVKQIEAMLASGGEIKAPTLIKNVEAKIIEVDRQGRVVLHLHPDDVMGIINATGASVSLTLKPSERAVKASIFVEKAL
jgi:hypothetical protein